MKIVAAAINRVPQWHVTESILINKYNLGDKFAYWIYDAKKTVLSFLLGK